jgi:hypothetical protein
MPNNEIPAVGEVFKGYVPATRQLRKITLGSAATNDVVLGDTGVYTVADVSEPIVVFGIYTQVETAVTSSVTITLGDSDGAARFFDSATIAPQSTGAVLVASTGLTVPYVYATAQDILATVAAATVAAGLVNVWIDYAVVAE